MPLSLPQKIGNYRVVAQLGQGGMARALLAMRHGPGGFRKLFVIKQLRPDLFAKPSFVEMFLDEARLAAMLSHPNVVQTHEIGREEGDCFISMDYLEGQSLGRLLRRVTRPSMPLGLHLMIISDVLAGLHYAHELADYDGTPLAVVHRDVSPGNVFVTYDGQVKLLDFGIAKAAGSTFQTEVGVLKGKLAYMAPEQAHADVVDRRSDLFSVGVMLWEALAERRMVEKSESEPVTLHKRVNGLWPSIGEVRPDIAPALRAVCDKALAPDPANRYQTADEFRLALVKCLELVGGQPSRDELARLITGAFVNERKKLAAKITATIEAVESGAEIETDQYLIPRNRRSTTDLPIGDLESPLSPIAGEEMMVTRLKQPPPRRARQALIGALVVAAIATAVIVYSRSRGGSEAGVSSSAASGADKELASVTPATALDASSAESGPETLGLSIAVTPRDARIELDGAALAENPYRGKVERDDKEHVLRVSAEGYETSERRVRFERDLHLEVVLVKADGSKDPVVMRERRRRARERERKAAEAAEKAAAEAAAIAAKAKADAEARAKAAAAKANDKPKAGDSLKPPSRDSTRKIDEKNPYQ